MPQKMCINLQDLSKTGKTWQWVIPASRMMREEGNVNALVGVCQDVHWQGSIHYSEGLYHLDGSWKTAIERQCVRCLCEFEWLTHGECQRDYSLQPLVDMDEEAQLDIEMLPSPGFLNLMDVLREDIWLAWESCVICKDSCKGLCQSCGVNLNAESCECGDDHVDHPFAALAKIKFDT